MEKKNKTSSQKLDFQAENTFPLCDVNICFCKDDFLIKNNLVPNYLSTYNLAASKESLGNASKKQSMSRAYPNDLDAIEKAFWFSV